jgi:hypothetical protein
MSIPFVELQDVSRVSGAESVTDGGTWDKFDAGQTPALEEDFVYQGNASISNKVGTSEGGVELEAVSPALDVETTQHSVLFKVIASNYAALNVQGATGMILYIGSGTTTDRVLFYAFGSDNYPPAGGWQFVLWNPNIAGYISATQDSPDLTAVEYFGLSCDFTATSRAENVAMDAIELIEVGGGLLMTRGDSTDPECTFQDFVDFDEGTVGNRYGMVRSIEGVILVSAYLQFGTGGAADEFIDNGPGTMIFIDGPFGPGTVGLRMGTHNGGSEAEVSNWSFIGRGNETIADSRPDFWFAGSVQTGATLTACTFVNFREFKATRYWEISNCIFDGGFLFDDTFASAHIIDSCTFKNATTVAGEHYVLANLPTNFSNCDWEFSAGHAVRCDTVGTYAWIGNTDSGYTGTRGSNLIESTGSTDAMFYNNSGGLITLDVSGGGQAPSVRNGAGATTQVNLNAIVTFDEMKDDTEVRIYEAGTDTEIDGIENATAGSADDRNFAASIEQGLSVDYVLHSVLYETIRVEAFSWPTTDQTVNVQQRLDRNYDNP